MLQVLLKYPSKSSQASLASQDRQQRGFKVVLQILKFSPEFEQGDSNLSILPVSAIPKDQLFSKKLEQIGRLATSDKQVTLEFQFELGFPQALPVCSKWSR